MKNLIYVLEAKGYGYKKEDGYIVINHYGYVCLESLTTLPENVKFENQGNVYLENLTTLSENVKFENQGNVYLESLTTLPENVKFENQGHVCLERLTTLPENVKFENQGNVYLENLTTLPENVKFENQGYVYLGSLNGKTITYRGKKLKIRHIDGETMIIQSSKEKDGFIISKALYLKGGELKNMPSCYIAEKENLYAHGESMKKAIEDVNFKYMQINLDKNKLVSQIKARGTITKNDYRLLTGACQMGVNNFCSELNIIEDEISVQKALEITKGRYGYETFKRLLDA